MTTKHNHPVVFGRPLPESTYREVPGVTDAMVDAYLQANDAYWKRTDDLPQKPDKWRNGTPREATRESLRAALATLQGLSPAQATPIDMVLYCPNCGQQHVDAPDERTPDWKNEPHRSHLCHGCGCIWRPADVPTNGVAELKTTGKADTWKVQPGPMSGAFPVSDAAAPVQATLTDEQIKEIAETLPDPMGGFQSWGVSYGYRQDSAGEYTVPRVPAVAFQFARALFARAGAVHRLYR